MLLKRNCSLQQRESQLASQCSSHYCALKLPLVQEFFNLSIKSLPQTFQIRERCIRILFNNLQTKNEADLAESHTYVLQQFKNDNKLGKVLCALLFFLSISNILDANGLQDTVLVLLVSLNFVDLLLKNGKRFQSFL